MLPFALNLIGKRELFVKTYKTEWRDSNVLKGLRGIEVVDKSAYNRLLVHQ
jgi:hypothetical protein